MSRKHAVRWKTTWLLSLLPASKQWTSQTSFKSSQELFTTLLTSKSDFKGRFEGGINYGKVFFLRMNDPVFYLAEFYKHTSYVWT